MTMDLGNLPQAPVAGRLFGWILPCICLCLILSACARLPDVDHLNRPGNATIKPTVVDGQGDVGGKKASQAVPQRKGHTKADAKLLAGLEEAATGRPLIAGNKVTLLFDGPATITAMMAAVALATDSVNLETYLFDQDPLGMRFADLLIAKQQEGVQVNIIYDCVGTLGTPQSFFDRMQKAGINLLPYQPVSPLHRGWRWRINNRDHRKILVVDGKVAFAGGVNITEAYSSSSHFRAHLRPGSKAGWRDTHIQIEGPAVAALQWIFLDNWLSQKEGVLPDRDYFPNLMSEGDKVLRVLRSQSGSHHEIFKAYHLAITGATKSIHLTAAYFVPDRQTLEALLEAAARGVDVKIIMPSVSDNWLTTHARHARYARMLKGGIRIYELRASVLHAKTAVIDGSWSTVGSTNMDMRSFLLNKEVNVIVMGDAFGEEMERAFQVDLMDSNEITYERWKHRPVKERVGEWFADLISYWL